MPKQIKVTDELYERLKERANGQPIPKLLRELLDGEDFKAAENTDQLLEQLDKQSKETYVDPLIRDLEPDELPECCQSIYGGSVKDRCEHWVDKRPAGFYNTLTHKWASDPDYYKYV